MGAYYEGIETDEAASDLPPMVVTLSMLFRPAPEWILRAAWLLVPLVGNPRNCGA